MRCRHCDASLKSLFLDLGFAPPSNAYLNAGDLYKPEKYYPLRVLVCEECWLVQTEDYAHPNELFCSDYSYFSSTSSGWLAHAKNFAESTIRNFNLTKNNLVVEIASNDGYLLKNYLAAGIPCLGIEPTDSTATIAEQIGIPVLRQFFGEVLGKDLAKIGKQADLIIGNNVYAHVPDINDFTLGLKALLKQGGCVTLEFPHLLQMIKGKQFDTVYHEHFSYLSFHTVERIFSRAGLRIWHAEALPTHGGSLRIYGCHAGDCRLNQSSVARLREEEDCNLICDIATYNSFQAIANGVKDNLLEFLITAKKNGKIVVGYGAAAKGNTLLNYAGVKPDLLPFICDAAVAKQNRFMPGSHIPILPPKILTHRRPDYLLILPWNIADEVRRDNASMASQGTRFVTAVPHLKIS